MMNPTDQQVLQTIVQYHATHGTYPRFVEVTPEFQAQMTYRSFSFFVPLKDVSFSSLDLNVSNVSVSLHKRMQQTVVVPIIPLGDWVCSSFLIQRMGSSDEEDFLHNELHAHYERWSASLVVAGLHITDVSCRSESWSYGDNMRRLRITGLIYGHEQIVREQMAR